MIGASYLSDAMPGKLSVVQRRRRLALIFVATALCGGLPFVAFSPAEGFLHEALEVLGTVLIVLAILGRSWCTIYIGGRKKAEVVSTGPYSVSRNPLYLFSLVGIAGVGAQTGSAIMIGLLLALGLVIFLPVILKEEVVLQARFGTEYETYCRAVPRFGPRFRTWKDMETVVVRPKFFVQTARDGMLFLLPIPICEIVGWLQEAGYIVPLITIS